MAADAMAADEPPTYPHHNPFSGFDHSVERMVGVGMLNERSDKDAARR